MAKTPKEPEFSLFSPTEHENLENSEESGSNTQNFENPAQITTFLAEEPKNPDFDGPNANETDNSPENPEIPPNSSTEPQIPIHIALPAQMRRVREEVLPSYYAVKFTPTPPDQPQVDVDTAITMMQGALACAEYAMMAQNVRAMLFVHAHLATYEV